MIPADQDTHNIGVGLPSVHQRYTRANDEHAFAFFSAQALACEGHAHDSSKSNSDGTPSAARKPSPQECAISASTGQMPPATFCVTPGWVPGAPQWEQPGVCSTPGALQPPTACMPIKADTLSFHSAAVNCQHSYEDTAFTSINCPADAAVLKGHEDTHPRGIHTLNDAKIDHNMHACEPDDANKPEGTINQATYHLPGWVPGAPPLGAAWHFKWEPCPPFFCLFYLQVT